MFKLKEILAKAAEDLTDEEKAFLNEKRAELSDEDKEKFAECLLAEEEEKGLDVEDVKKLVGTHIQEAMAKKVDEISTEIVAKFLSGAREQRAKALADRPEKNDEAKGQEKTREFMKALLSGDTARAKKLSTATSGSDPDDSQAGLLIPSELMNEVLRLKETQYGLARRDMRYLPFSGPGNSRVIPSLGTSVSVFWTGEGAKKKSTQAKFSVVTQTLKKLAAIVPMTEEIIEDSLINLNTLLGELFAEAVSKEEDIQFFTGTGSPWTGLLNNGSINKITQASGVEDLTADDLLDMIDATPTAGLNGSKFYMHRTVKSVIRKLKDSQGRYIYQEPGGAQPATLWNYPVEESDAFPAVADIEAGDQYILFGNLKATCVFGDKQQLRVKLLTEATITDSDDETAINLAEQDMVALRIVERVGYVCGLPKGLTALEAGEPAS